MPVRMPPQASPVAAARNGMSGSAHPGLAALIALCHGDAAIGDLIRAVAATLERERPVSTMAG
jgi:hypothetical protein